MKGTATPETWMTLDEAATHLRVTRATLYRWIKAGQLHSYRLGARSVRLKREEIDRLVRAVPLPGGKPADEWAALSEKAFADDWDSEEDSVYDNWEETHGVRKR